MKKECEFFREKLRDYAMGGLESEPELVRKISEHTAICAECWNEADAYKKAMETAASVMRVEFSEDVWEMQRREIIKRVTYRPDIIAGIKKALASFFTTRRLAAGFALALIVAAGAGAAFRHYSYTRELKTEQTVISRLDMLENIEIIERLEFYKKLSEAKGLL